MEFNPQNRIVQLCLQGISMKDGGKSEAASRLFQQAWDEATQDFERFISAYFLAQNQKDGFDQLRWLEAALLIALKVNDHAVTSAFPVLYAGIAKCHENLRDPLQAIKYGNLAASIQAPPSDPGPFYHGTKADLGVGDLLTAGGSSNYRPELKMNHIYFTALVNGAGLAAGLAKGDSRERVYLVEPTGKFEDDPNVTNKKFPGNMTRSYRSSEPLKVIGEATNWRRQTPEELEKWRKRLAGNRGDIIN